MDRELKTPIPISGGPVARLIHWVDVRTGVKSLAQKALEEPIPGGARFAYVFGSGLLFIFLLQVITGVSLALYYTPTAETAHTSVAYITKQVAGGAFLRSLHSYGSSAMIIVLGLHFLQTFLYGSFKGRRELLWCSGALLSFLILGMGFTGYLLPWDQKAYFATAVGTNVAGETPLIGSLLTRFLRGGNTIGTLTISRFYVAHVFLIPAIIFLFIGAHIFLFRKAGPAGPIEEDPISPKLAPEPFYPRQVLLDMGFALVIVAILGGLSYLRPVTLGPIANPADSHFLPRPEWYYLPMFEWLKLWEGPLVVLGVVVLPGLLATAFFLMPFLDRRLERKPWRRPIPALAVAIVVLGMVYLGIKSQIDDSHGPAAAQLALQHQEEKAYSDAPFEPYVAAADGTPAPEPPLGPVNPLIAQGKGIFTERGCVGCHGATGSGTPLAPSLVGITGKFHQDDLIALLHNPNSRMKAGGMPAVAASPTEMSALLSYLGVLGTRAANVAPVSQTPSLLLAASAKRGPLTPVGVPAAGSPSPSSNLPAEFAAGQQAFQERACFACHGDAGAGGRAPALAPLIAKMDNEELARLFQNPTAKMSAGGMPPVVATPQELHALIAYLRTLRSPQNFKSPVQQSSVQQLAPAPDQDRKAETPAAPVAAIAAITQTVAETLASSHPPASEFLPGRLLFVSQGCVACHGTDARGTQLAPSLIGIGAKYPGNALPSLLHHPTSKMTAGGMPPVLVNESQMVELVAYLSGLNEKAAAILSVSQANADPQSIPASQQAHEVTVAIQATRQPEASNTSSDPLAMRGRQVFQHQNCGMCHGADGLHGTAAAPGLAGTASLLPESTLEHMLLHHTAKMQKGGMPNTNFNPQDRKAIVAYIRSLPPGAEARESRAFISASHKTN
ncbi:MAG TPA: c-type cytochrome [Terracidiphilus sp.]|jgi:ubiquinol-cytochrome c reductase cytochrome b subunit